MTTSGEHGRGRNEKGRRTANASGSTSSRIRASTAANGGSQCSGSTTATPGASLAMCLISRRGEAGRSCSPTSRSATCAARTVSGGPGCNSVGPASRERYHERLTRDWFNGRTRPSQGRRRGSIPLSRSVASCDFAICASTLCEVRFSFCDIRARVRHLDGKRSVRPTRA